ncbi:PIN domain-containing protein [Aetokthonos hydrillicola Thurmond2011]|uniref:Ribonuclease VapC n=1 Tax=Aetokthonos hydrillicola Thurmond2011 TaxID=2712845 RepID=A0AAP5MCH8_9CYAN|nr:PIN domain-containing protein [Aetokthonos hydrillicola]MBO3459155.1 PIN domain-containing protein [Aetokthonos hydrillicola CCALA 1050]MBW4584114.1 PIN domain-containing protein [Aetokthonos hydrillicola CCALA 1050]MDR9898353.1 PIN domain-containing protein [Aetokthonos hydrillicola Thurmond2011]
MERRIIADTSGIIALLDKDEQHHIAAVEIVRRNNILIPATVLPEVDYITTKYLGERVARAFLEDLVEGSFTYLSVELEDLAQASRIIEQYKDLPLGLVDASLVALVERYRIQRILTLDRRHFGLIQTEKIDYLELLP